MVEEIFCWWAEKNLRGVEGEKILGVAGEGGKSLRELRGKRWKKKKISP